jgi:hypothetical protein
MKTSGLVRSTMSAAVTGWVAAGTAAKSARAYAQSRKKSGVGVAGALGKIAPAVITRQLVAPG